MHLQHFCLLDFAGQLPSSQRAERSGGAARAFAFSKLAGEKVQHPALGSDLLCPCSMFGQVSRSEGLCDNHFVRAQYVALSIRPHTRAGGWSPVHSGCYAEAVCLVYSRSKVMKNQIQPACQAAQWQLPLRALVILLTLLSYCLISLSKLQPDLTYWGRVKSNSDRLYTNYFPGCHSHVCF